MTIKQYGGIFGRNPTFNNVGVQGSLTGISNLSISGNLIVTSGKGIDFSATAGTGTSELFDDYEEGTWTPVIAGSTTAGTYETASVSGLYTKIGRQVTVHCLVTTAAAITAGGAGDLTITGLPFAKGAGQNSYAAATTGGLNYTAGSSIAATFGTSGSTSTIFFLASASNAGNAFLSISLVGVSKLIGFSLTYNT
jgi:hypothetical protein